MKRLLDPREHARALRQLLWWTLLVVPVGVLAGSASAFFLWSLDRVTEIRWHNGWLLFLLPVAGVAVGWLYHRFGGAAAGGNNLIIEQIHQPGGGVPRRMAPLVLVGTLITHLFGGSAGREGTAVQMGGSLASAFARVCRLSEENLRVVLLAGVAAGFGSVFGTPLTGAIFAMEVLVVGRMRYDALIPVLVASLVGDWTCTAWGIGHAHYHIDFGSGAGRALHFDGALVAKVVLAAAAFGLVSRLFSELTHSLQHGFQRLVPKVWLRPAVGALLVIGLAYALGTRDYLGLGVRPELPDSVTLLSAFEAGGTSPWSWWWKLLFTAITLSAGFKGGEVTPLFFIGATLGNTLAVLLGAPVDLFAGLGFVAVFAGAANTPLACTVMGIELFGAQHGVYFAAACFVAYHFSGHSGIYLSQRIGVAKRDGSALPPDASLREAREFGSELEGLSFADMAEALPFSAGEPAGTANPMKTQHRIVSREMGKVRIYLAPRDRVPADGLFGRLAAKPVYRALIQAAKAEGLGNAAAFTTHYGFSASGKVQAQGAEIANPNLTICVELIDTKEALEAFCRRHGDLLKGRTIVYKHVEHWDITGHEVVEQDTSPDEVIDGNKGRKLPDRS